MKCTNYVKGEKDKHVSCAEGCDCPNTDCKFHVSFGKE